MHFLVVVYYHGKTPTVTTESNNKKRADYVLHLARLWNFRIWFTSWKTPHFGILCRQPGQHQALAVLQLTGGGAAAGQLTGEELQAWKPKPWCLIDTPGELHSSQELEPPARQLCRRRGRGGQPAPSSRSPISALGRQLRAWQIADRDWYNFQNLFIFH